MDLEYQRLEQLNHSALAQLGREWMLFGHLYDRALMPQIAIRLGMDEITKVAIAEWKGASPNYTRRMRQLMAISGDDVSAIFKALQLDVGFVHEYMDVGYEIIDESHGEFWLNHCGALLDVEPQGEQMVINMCHHIEDPTFDATAVATNPKARIRPIHRPPRVPNGRTPHCRWELTIDPDTTSIEPDPLTLLVGALPLCDVENNAQLDFEASGMSDYSGPFNPNFVLEDLSHATLIAVLREFAMQTQLLSTSADLFLSERHDRDLVKEIQAAQWEGASWVSAARIARLLGVNNDIDGIIAVINCHPGFPPGVNISSTIHDQTSASVTFQGELLDPLAPGWLGLLANGETSAIRGIAQALDRTSQVSIEPVGAGRVAFSIDIDSGRNPVDEPESVAFTKLSTAADWTFRT